MRAIVAVLALAACGHPAPAPAPSNTGATTPPAPTGSAPTVAWIDNGFDTPGLPSITADGTSVIVAEIANDSGRGNPNLKLVTRDRHDGVGESITILKIGEVDDMFAHDGSHPALDARIAAANTWLAKLWHDRALSPLARLEVDLSGDAYAAHLARAGAVELDWQKDHLVIKSAGRTLYDQMTPLTWQASASGSCKNPAKLGAAWVDVDKKLALVEIRYNGDDTCWEPSPVQHVIAW